VGAQRILGIDPGSHHLGIGCIEKDGRTLRLIFAETINAKKTDTLFDRLGVIKTRLLARIDELNPDEIVIENMFTAKNVKTALSLGMARGVALSTVIGRGIGIYEYAPTQVKMVVTGYGRADKEQVRKMVGLTLGLGGREMDLGFDASDAVALAICHANTKKFGTS
jgi:crossover junction endodeoxyribonuclease RuvC